MATRKLALSFLPRLVGGFLFFHWCYTLISMDSYLFSNPRSLQFWSAGIGRVLDAALVSCGLIIAPSEYAQRHRFISGFLVALSLASSFFLLADRLYNIPLFFNVLIHIVSFGVICKNTRVMQTLLAYFRRESKV
jgi:hypothetical protein